MASTDATYYPIKNQAYRLYFTQRKTDGTLLTSWTVPTSAVSIDGAGFASAGTPVEVGHGQGYLDLTADQMNGAAITVFCSCTNSGAALFVTTIYTIDTSEVTGRWDSATVKKLEALGIQLYAAEYNRAGFSSGGNTYTVYKEDNLTAMLSWTVNASDSASTKTEAT